MKKFRHYALLLITAMAVFGCSKDYDDTAIKNDISDLQSRVEKLETWCTTVNSQISALQGLVTALEAKDYVTGVTPVVEGSVTIGYTISFTKSAPVTILHGTNGKDGSDGITPTIGVKADTDGLYYWTIKLGDGEVGWLYAADGKTKIRTTGDKGTDGTNGTNGVTPTISVDTFEGALYWKVNGAWMENNGQKVPATGGKGDKGDKGDAGVAGSAGAQGDSVFKKDGIDLTDPDNVTFTLADGVTKITFPRTSAIKIFDSFIKPIKI